MAGYNDPATKDTAAAASAERIESPPPRRYWFHAKRYGYGWGLPATWEGWVVLAGYVGAVFGVIPWLAPPDQGPGAFAAGVTVASLVVVALCWWKGEPPSWRWGG